MSIIKLKRQDIREGKPLPYGIESEIDFVWRGFTPACCGQSGTPVPTKRVHLSFEIKFSGGDNSFSTVYPNFLLMPSAIRKEARGGIFPFSSLCITETLTLQISANCFCVKFEFFLIIFAFLQRFSKLSLGIHSISLSHFVQSTTKEFVCQGEIDLNDFLSFVGTGVLDCPKK